MAHTAADPLPCAADPGDRDQPDAPGRRQDDHHRRPRRRPAVHRQGRHDLPARTLTRTGVRHERGSSRRWPRPGGSDGGHQPALHRRLQRHRFGQQSARCLDRQPHPSRQRPRNRRATCHVEARRGHERSGVTRHHGRSRRTRKRLPASRWLRHRRGIGDHGHLLPGYRPGGSQGAHRSDRGRIHA